MRNPTNREELLAFLREIKPQLERDFAIQQLGVFGSFARNTMKPTSDIDLLVEFIPNTSSLFDLQEALRSFLQQKTSRQVDLCVLKYVKPYAKKYILKDAVYV